MKRPPEIKINQFQLAVLLNEHQKQSFKIMLNEGIFCHHCSEIAIKGVTVEQLFLTSLNDIMVSGICNVCNENVKRIIEFGENKEFYKKANDFRTAIRN